MIFNTAIESNDCSIAQVGLTDIKKYRSFILVVLSLVDPQSVMKGFFREIRNTTDVDKLERELEEFHSVQFAGCCVVDGIIDSFEISCASV